MHPKLALASDGPRLGRAAQKLPSCLALTRLFESLRQTGCGALADCSVAVFLFDAEADNLGLAYVPRPVEPGDVLALADGPPLRVTLLVQLPRCYRGACRGRAGVRLDRAGRRAQRPGAARRLGPVLTLRRGFVAAAEALDLSLDRPGLSRQKGLLRQPLPRSRRSTEAC